jgi:hypothetical protein
MLRRFLPSATFRVQNLSSILTPTPTSVRNSSPSSTSSSNSNSSNNSHPTQFEANIHPQETTFIDKCKSLGMAALLGPVPTMGGFDKSVQGLVVDSVEDGHVKLSMHVTKEVANSFGTLHGNLFLFSFFFFLFSFFFFFFSFFFFLFFFFN